MFALSWIATAQAACLDWRDPLLQGYYYPTLADETRESVAVVIGHVVNVREEKIPEDPQGVAAYDYTIEVQETLKGKISARFHLVDQPSTASYPMSAQSTHLLFVQRGFGRLFIDNCGNSAEVSAAAPALIYFGKMPAVDLPTDAIARRYRNLEPVTPDPVLVNAELARLCRGVTTREIDEAHAEHGPHANSAVTIYMNELAKAAWRGKARSYPVGSVIVKEKETPTYLAVGVGGMVKRAPGFDPGHGDWEYFYFNDPKELEAGRIESCVACHASPKARDHVFGSWAQAPKAPFRGTEATIHGRLSYYNGTPFARIWVIGTNRLLSVNQTDDVPDMPKELRDLMTFGREMFADFSVEPLERSRPGWMQRVRIVSATRIRVLEDGKVIRMTP